MLKGRQIYLKILRSFDVTDAETHINDFERVNALRMHDDNLHKFIIDWDSLLLKVSKLPSPEILESLFRTQIQRHPWMKDDMNIYNRAPPGASEKCYDWLHSRVKAVIDLHKLQRNQHSLKHSDRDRSPPRSSAYPTHVARNAQKGTNAHFSIWQTTVRLGTTAEQTTSAFTPANRITATTQPETFLLRVREEWFLPSRQQVQQAAHREVQLLLGERLLLQQGRLRARSHPSRCTDAAAHAEPPT